MLPSSFYDKLKRRTMETYKTVRGMQDLLPEQLLRWHFFEEKARLLLQEYGYKEIRTPLVEEKTLFERSVGEATDIVEKEMYTFCDRKGRHLALRPEGTASVVRAYVQARYYQMRRITRFWYQGPMFRYDRPQRGRYRQFYQLGVEVFGGKHPLFDVEVISLLILLLQTAGLSQPLLRVNSLGCIPCQQAYSQLLKNFLHPYRESLCPDCVRRLERNTLRVFDCKNISCLKILQRAPSPAKHLCPTCQQHYQLVLSTLSKMNTKLLVDEHLVRGLDYYTGTVFEVTAGNDPSALAAGGRYDTLVASFGGPEVPAVGFAIGLERLMNMISTPVKEQPLLRAFFLGDKARLFGFSFLAELRKKGIPVEVDFEERPLKNHLQAASREKVKWCLFFGENELSEEKILLKNMETREQHTLPLSECFQKIKELIC